MGAIFWLGSGSLWECVSAVSAAVAAIAAAFSVLWAHRQTKAARAGVMVQAWIEAERIFCDDGFRVLRGRIYGFSRTVDASEWQRTGKAIWTKSDGGTVEAAKLNARRRR